MTVIRIQKIIWDRFNTEHIKKHNVSIEEVEDVIRSDTNIKEGYSGKKIYTSRVGSRLLSVIGIIKGNKFYTVTARDASKKEREDYYNYEKDKKD